MKKLYLLSILAFIVFCFVSCGGDDPEGSGGSGNGGIGQTCESNFDCPIGLTCDAEKKVCTDGSNGGNGGNGGSGGNGDGGDGGNGDGGDDGNTTPGKQDGDDDPITGTCEPGKKQTCPYQGAPETENVGLCKAAIRTCKEDGTWGKCEGGYTPVDEIGELCSDGIDNDCDGEADNGTDCDGDGVGACSDCCESTETCPDPKNAWDPETHNCSYSGETEISEECESDISATSTDPMDYAKALGICKTTTEDSSDWGLIEAKITVPNGSSAPHANSNGLVSKFGNVIVPKAGSYMLALTSGKISNNKFQTYEYQGVTSGAPSDWLEKHSNKFPSAPVCNQNSDINANNVDVKDAVMLTLKIRTPQTAKSFSFNIYFLSKEYSTYVCSKFNDFFISLLNSGYTSTDPNLQNPADMNLAMDANGNPVGINLAPAGLFTQCKVQSTITNSYGTFDASSCTGTDELQGTGFESNGGTGWLTTRGNVKGGEIITLRLAIWDLSDDRLDSLVLIDNFKWGTAAQKPGTGY